MFVWVCVTKDSSLWDKGISQRTQEYRAFVVRISFFLSLKTNVFMFLSIDTEPFLDFVADWFKICPENALNTIITLCFNSQISSFCW